MVVSGEARPVPRRCWGGEHHATREPHHHHRTATTRRLYQKSTHPPTPHRPRQSCQPRQPQNGWTCSACGQFIKTGQALYGCRACNYAVCESCRSPSLSAAALPPLSTNMGGLWRRAAEASGGGGGGGGVGGGGTMNANAATDVPTERSASASASSYAGGGNGDTAAPTVQYSEVLPKGPLRKRLTKAAETVLEPVLSSSTIENFRAQLKGQLKLKKVAETTWLPRFLREWLAKRSGRHAQKRMEQVRRHEANQGATLALYEAFAFRTAHPFPQWSSAVLLLSHTLHVSLFSTAHSLAGERGDPRGGAGLSA